MIVKSLVDDRCYSEKFVAEHGLSLLITTKNHKILFDTGSSAAFIKNAEALGENLKDVDIAVLSHGHYDHGGGIKSFLEINQKAPVYVDYRAFGDFYHGEEKYIGLDKDMAKSDRLWLTHDKLKLDENIELLTFNDLKQEFDRGSEDLCKKIDGELIPDEFLHEQFLIICENGKKVVFGGCAHKGIFNLLNWTSPDVYIGGFHFKNIDIKSHNGQEFLNFAAVKLKTSDTLYYTCHCTGKEQFNYLKARVGENLSYLKLGDTIEI